MHFVFAYANSARRVQKVKVLFDHKAEAEDELSLAVGDVVEFISESIEGHWWEGKLGDKLGLFPSNFIKLRPQEKGVHVCVCEKCHFRCVLR